MKKYLILLFLTISTVGYSQTMKETESFLKKYIEAFPMNNADEGEKNEVLFKKTERNDYVFVYVNKAPYLGVSMSFFSPKDVESIIIDKAQMKNQNCIIIINLKPNSGIHVFNDSEKEKVDKIQIIIGNSSFTEK